MTEHAKKRVAVLTSGGDAQGMNAAVRAIVRTALDHGLEVYAILEGYQGMVEGGKLIRKMEWDSVGGILQKGGTFIGTARSEDFRTPEGRLQAARNLLEHEIDNLIVIGGDGSLTGAKLFREEWPKLVNQLASQGSIPRDIADKHPHLLIAGLVGSIDNDFYGTDMTIGADTALHRITEAVDAITSTADSHQRTFVVKVMGRNCGYLALMGALATGADWVLIPESPPEVDNWGEVMCSRLKAGRKAGRRDTIVIIAEGARDRYGNIIGSTQVAQLLEECMGEEVRVTVLGHVQRGGTPSAFDRNLGTLLGHAAVEMVLNTSPDAEPQVVGLRGNRITHTSLKECVTNTQEVTRAIDRHEYAQAMELRGSSFNEAFTTFKTMLRALPHPPQEGQKRLRFAIMHSGSPAPGMNTAVRAATRIGLDQGQIMIGVRNGFSGLIEGDVFEMSWMTVNGWAPLGGSELGTNRKVPSGSDLYHIARTIENNQIDGLLIIGGWNGYESAYEMFLERRNFPSLIFPLFYYLHLSTTTCPGQSSA